MHYFLTNSCTLAPEGDDVAGRFPDLPVSEVIIFFIEVWKSCVKITFLWNFMCNIICHRVKTWLSIVHNWSIKGRLWESQLACGPTTSHFSSLITSLSIVRRWVTGIYGRVVGCSSHLFLRKCSVFVGNISLHMYSLWAWFISLVKRYAK